MRALGIAETYFLCDPIGQLAETRRQMCKINWLTR